MQLSLIPGSSITRPALRYFGGKWLAAPWIIQSFPAHRLYLEPYGGGFSVGLRKLPAPIEIYNDLNPGTANFFRQLRDRPDELLGALAQTARTRDEFLLCQEPAADPLEVARRFYVCSALSHAGGGGRWSSGTSAARLQQESHFCLESLRAVSDRLRGVEIQQRDALQAIAEYGQEPQALLYVDPPYLFSVRGSKDKRHKVGAPRQQYACEMGRDQQHQELLEALLRCRARVIVSGKRCELYDQVLKGWRTDSRSFRNSVRQISTEVVWMNF